MDGFIKKNEKYLYRIIYSSMVFSLSYLCGLPIGIKLIIPLQILIVLAITSIVSFLITHKILTFILILCLLVVLVIISYFFKTIAIVFFSKSYSFFINILNHIKGNEQVLPKNQLLFWAIIVVLLSIFTWYMIYKVKRISFLLPVYMGGILYYWYIYYDAAYWMMALFLFLYLILLGLNYHFKEEKNGNKLLSNKFYYLYKSRINIILSYSLIIVALSLFFPKSSFKIDLDWLNDKVKDIFPGINEFRSDEIIDNGFQEILSNSSQKTGYSIYPSKLGGPIILDDRAVMNVYGEGPIYLRGNVRHTYTGTHWLTEEENWTSFDEWTNYINMTDENKYYEEVEFSIINRFSSMNILFSPYKPYKIDGESIYGVGEGTYVKVNQDGILSSSIPLESGDKYTVTALKPLTYEQLIDLGINRKKEDLENISLYLQVPEDRISYFTKELTKEIVKGAKTDLEKAKAIEAYLRSNYRYTLEVEPVPEGVDFVDYFLFDSREGYCTYYATAMAIMLRLEGIPSRYVEGFLAYEPIQDGIYIVRNRNAHAWVEAFIEPVGWMIFEPTSVYPLVPNVDEPLAATIEQNVDDLDIDTAIGQDSSANDVFNLKEDNFNEYVTSTNNSFNIRKIIIVVISILSLIIFIKFSIKIVKLKYYNIKVKNMDNKEKALYLYNDIMKLMEIRGITPNTGETHYEFANKIAYNFPIMNDKIGIKEITEIFVRSKYSDLITSDEDIELMKDYMKLLKKHVKRFMGLRTYLYRMYFK